MGVLLGQRDIHSFFSKVKNQLMKFIHIVLIALLSGFTLKAQSTSEKSIPVSSGKSVSLDFKWPELIQIKAWDKNEVKIVAKVDINKGQNDDAFQINVDNTGESVLINSEIKDYKNLPRKIVIKMDGQEYFFNTDDRNSPEIRAFEEEHGSASYSYVNYGVIMEITLEVWVPKSSPLEVYSKFGLVEIDDFSGAMNIHSKFGGIDITTVASIPIKAGTKFGEKYTNLTVPINSIQVGSHPGRWDWVQLGRNNGAVRELKSEFGNIYIRRQ